MILPKLLIRTNLHCFVVSVIWTLDKNYKVVDTWFGRSVIRSACEMEYEQAQELFNGADTVKGLDKMTAQKLKKSVVKLVDVLRVVRVCYSAMDPSSYIPTLDSDFVSFNLRNDV